VRRGSTIVTSNRPAAEWYALFPNAVLAEARSTVSSTPRTTSPSRARVIARASVRTSKTARKGTRSDDVDENEALRSPRTPAAERARVMTLGAKGVKTKRN